MAFDIEAQRALYHEKNAHLDKFLESVEPLEFYREVFPVGSFERKGHYEDAKGNGIALIIPHKGRHVKRRTLTDELV